MKTITLNEFKAMGPCWLDDPKKAALLDKIGARQKT